MEHPPKDTTCEPQNTLAKAPTQAASSPRLPDAREVLRVARAETLGHSMARRVF
jgi:hypothetical protein